MRWKSLVPVSAVVLLPALAWAQTPPSPAGPAVESVTLDQALAFARTHHVDLAVVKARVAAARADLDVPGTRWQPTVGVTGQVFGYTANNTTASYVGSPVVDVARISSTRTVSGLGNLGPEPATLVAVGARQLLYDGGLTAAEQTLADALLRSETATARSAWLDVSLQVEESWFAVQAAHRLLAAAQQARTRQRAHRDLVAAYVEKKLRPMADVTREDALLARYDVDVLQADAGLTVTRALLAAAMGTEADQVDAVDSQVALPPSPSLDLAVRRAIQQSPRLQAAAARLDAQQARTRVEEVKRHPELHATAGVSGQAGGAAPSSGSAPAFGGWLPEVPNWFAGVVLNWPLYDGHQNAVIASSSAHEAVLAREIDALREARRVAVRRAWSDVQAALQQLPAIQKARDAAQLNATQADARLRAGLANGLEVVDAETRLAEADILIATADFRAARARAILARTMAEDWYGSEASAP